MATSAANEQSSTRPEDDRIMEMPQGLDGLPAEDGHTRLRGKKRILQTMKRIGSSQSLMGIARPRTATYRGSGAGSISCFSLSSPSNGEIRHFSSYGFSTGPNTPGIETPQHLEAVRAVSAQSLPQSPEIRSYPRGVASARATSRPFTSDGRLDLDYDYFSLPLPLQVEEQKVSINHWQLIPHELKLQVLSNLEPKQIVRSSLVSKAWHEMCFDGQLWAELDASDFYSVIPAPALIKIITAAGPFARSLNLRGCVQLWDSWRAAGLIGLCHNLENLSLQGCYIDRNSVHGLLHQNSRLVHIDLSGQGLVTNSTLKIIAEQCPKLELLNVSWCQCLDTRGLRKVITSCPELRDLRASEVKGFSDLSFMVELFNTNNLQRLVLTNCTDIVDEAFSAMIVGIDQPVDYLTGRRIVPPRKLRHLDLTRCKRLTDYGFRSLAAQAPDLEGLQISKCDGLTDSSIREVLSSLTKLTHLDMEELDSLSNASLQGLASSPCAATLKHLNLSYCESIGDAGMLPVLQACTSLRNVELDNTRISNLCLIEAASMVRMRAAPRSMSWDAACTKSTEAGTKRPRIALTMAVYDCSHVTWSGIREVLARNSEIRRPTLPAGFVSSPGCLDTGKAPEHRDVSGLYRAIESPMTARAQVPHQIIALKAFYGYQPTITEHTKRCLAGNLPAAQRLERKWCEYMMASEEAGAPGGFIGGVFAGFAGAGNGPWGLPGYAYRRRRRRAREAAMMHADEEAIEDESGAVIGRRRRARSGGAIAGQCSIM